MNIIKFDLDKFGKTAKVDSINESLSNGPLQGLAKCSVENLMKIFSENNTSFHSYCNTT